MKKIGFIGLGSMGEPMAINLLKAGVDVVVWNRSDAKVQILKNAGALAAKTVKEVFEQCDVVIMMLANAEVIDLVLSRRSNLFNQMIHGKTIINMGTNSPTFSKGLEKDIITAGGYFIEAPVSGSRKPAENAQLIAMLAGDGNKIASVQKIFSFMCREVVYCGDIPSALLMKLSVNIFLIATVTGLAESLHFAQNQGLDVEKFASILNASQMSSDISRVKNQKFLNKDFSKQAGITDVLANNKLIVDAARASGVSVPILDVCYSLYQKTQNLGLGNEDMISVVKAFGSNNGPE